MLDNGTLDSGAKLALAFLAGVSVGGWIVFLVVRRLSAEIIGKVWKLLKAAEAEK